MSGDHVDVVVLLATDRALVAKGGQVVVGIVQELIVEEEVDGVDIDRRAGAGRFRHVVISTPS